jgi:hypothetical protein
MTTNKATSPAQADRPWWLLYWPESTAGRVAIVIAYAAFALVSVYAIARVEACAKDGSDVQNVDSGTRELEARVQQYVPGFRFDELRTRIVEAGTAQAAMSALMATMTRLNAIEDRLAEDQQDEFDDFTEQVLACVFGMGLRVGPYVVDTKDVVPLGAILTEFGGPMPPGYEPPVGLSGPPNPTGLVELVCIERLTGAQVRVRGTDALKAYASKQGVQVTGLFAGGGSFGEAVYLLLSAPELR